MPLYALQYFGLGKRAISVARHGLLMLPNRGDRCRRSGFDRGFEAGGGCR